MQSHFYIFCYQIKTIQMGLAIYAHFNLHFQIGRCKELEYL